MITNIFHQIEIASQTQIQLTLKPNHNLGCVRTVCKSYFCKKRILNKKEGSSENTVFQTVIKLMKPGFLTSADISFGRQEDI